MTGGKSTDLRLRDVTPGRSSDWGGLAASGVGFVDSVFARIDIVDEPFP